MKREERRGEERRQLYLHLDNWPSTLPISLPPNLFVYALSSSMPHYHLCYIFNAALPMMLNEGALASRLHAHGKHGDPATRQLVMRVMDCVCAPLFSFITRCAIRLIRSRSSYHLVVSIISYHIRIDYQQFNSHHSLLQFRPLQQLGLNI